MSVRGGGSSVLVLMKSGHHLSPETASCCQMHDCKRWDPMSTLGRGLTWAQQAGRAGCGMSGARGGEKRGPGKTKGITDDSL